MRCVKDTEFLHANNSLWRNLILDRLTLEMKTVRSFETWVTVYRLTRCNDTEPWKSSATPPWEPSQISFCAVRDNSAITQVPGPLGRARGEGRGQRLAMWLSGSNLVTHFLDASYSCSDCCRNHGLSSAWNGSTSWFNVRFPRLLSYVRLGVCCPRR